MFSKSSFPDRPDFAREDLPCEVVSTDEKTIKPTATVARTDLRCCTENKHTDTAQPAPATNERTFSRTEIFPIRPEINARYSRKNSSFNTAFPTICGISVRSRPNGIHLRLTDRVSVFSHQDRGRPRKRAAPGLRQSREGLLPSSRHPLCPPPCTGAASEAPPTPIRSRTSPKRIRTRGIRSVFLTGKQIIMHPKRLQSAFQIGIHVHTDRLR